eukprot:3900216-Alexandrium_andersonii.AAC.1
MTGHSLESQTGNSQSELPVCDDCRALLRSSGGHRRAPESWGEPRDHRSERVAGHFGGWST